MQSLGNEDWGNTDATMRVLVADQEPEMLEAIARVFEVDVATTKATCIDLLRANHFDVIVACERLSDGSGLELLSHIGQRWPHVIRILAIEPDRRAMLRGRLGPFKLFETLSYPIDEQKLEAALERAAEQIAANEAAEARGSPASSAGQPAPSTPPPTARPAPSAAARPAPVGVVQRETTPAASTPMSSNRPVSSNRPMSSNAPTSSTQARPKDDARRPEGRTAIPSSAPPPRNGALPPSQVTPPPSRAASSASRSAAAPQGASFAGKQKTETGYPPLPSKGSKIVPLGSPAAGDYKILPHNYDTPMPGTLRGAREDDKKPSLQEKAASLAAGALSAVSKYIKPQDAERDPLDPTPKKKR
jgi:CheY-like chemotaxis protein